MLDPDVAAVFAVDAEAAESALQTALRMLIQLARKQVDEATSSTGTTSNSLFHRPLPFCGSAFSRRVSFGPRRLSTALGVHQSVA